MAEAWLPDLEARRYTIYGQKGKKIRISMPHT
jgi:hypothetical protein